MTFNSNLHPCPFPKKSIDLQVKRNQIQSNEMNRTGVVLCCVVLFRFDSFDLFRCLIISKITIQYDYKSYKSSQGSVRYYMPYFCCPLYDIILVTWSSEKQQYDTGTNKQMNENNRLEQNEGRH